MRDPLLTDRLILFDITEADAEALFDLDSDPEVMRYIGPRTAPDVAWYRDRIRTVYMPWQTHPWHGLWIVVDRNSSGFLGWVFVRPATASRSAVEMGWTRPGEVEIGYRYRKSAWGRGIATEAGGPLVQIVLEDPGTMAIVACAQAGNVGSIRVLEKLGLKRAGEVMLPDASEATILLARAK